jgi:hypothetical protein
MRLHAFESLLQECAALQSGSICCALPCCVLTRCATLCIITLCCAVPRWRADELLDRHQQAVNQVSHVGCILYWYYQ